MPGASQGPFLASWAAYVPGAQLPVRAPGQPGPRALREEVASVEVVTLCVTQLRARGRTWRELGLGPKPKAAFLGLDGKLGGL